MALYDYKCNSCNSVFEVSHAMDYDGSINCIYCDSSQTHKLMGACRFNTGNDLGPTASHLMSEQRKNTEQERGRVATALGKMKPTEQDLSQEPAHAGCVHHTRIELEERYGKIFPTKK